MKLTIVNFHIPKTAGSAFLARLFRSLRQQNQQTAIHNVSKRASTMDGTQPVRTRKAFELEQQDCIDDEFKVFTGHFRYRDIADLIEADSENALWMTFLRDPVHRVLSDYFYCISDVHDRQESFIDKFPNLEAYLDNSTNLNKQSDFLAPDADASVGETIEHIRENFGFVGCTERFDGDFEHLMSELLIAASHRERRNENPFPNLKKETYAKYKDVIYDRTAADRQLYQAFFKDETQSKIVLPRSFQEDPNIKAKKALLNDIEQLAPWHHKIQLSEGVWTGTGDIADQTGTKVSCFDPLKAMQNLTRNILPNGFEGRSFLDCACNGGGYSFAAKDLGASRVFGFDVREHWINQCKFIMQNRHGSTDNMEFRQADLLDLNFLDEEFDVTWFSGIFYHLPDPVAGLKHAADRTKELIFVNTATSIAEPDEEEIPAMRMKFEGTEEIMSGVHSLSWYPSGPKVMAGILNWMGFKETRLLFWHKKVKFRDRGVSGRLCIVGARQEGRLDGVPNAVPNDSFEGPLRAK